MYIKVDQFHGMRPQMAARKLGMYESQRTHNARLWRGELQPYDAPLPVDLPSKNAQGPVLSIYPMAGKWLNWLTDVDVVRSPVTRDSFDRHYYTGDGPMKTTTPNDATTGGTDFPVLSYDTGVPAPVAAPTVTVTGGSGGRTTRSYVFRYINEWGEVGAASPPVEVSGFVNGLWRATGVAPTSARNWNLNGIEYQFYRSDQAGTFRFVQQQPGLALTDNVPDTGLGEALPTVEYLPPPADLKGLVTLPNGFLAAFHTNEVCFSEPYQPHAWPDAYTFSFPDDIVALGVYSTTLVVGTTGRPSILSGVHPDSMVEDVLDVNHSCASKRSMIRYGQGVAFAAPEGVVHVTGRTARLLTEPLMECTDWEVYQPDSILATTYDDRYIGFYNRPPDPFDPDSTREVGGFILDQAEPTANFLLLTAHATAAHFDRATGQTFLAIGNVIHRFDAYERQMQGYWRSKRFVLPRKCCLTVAKVRWTPNSSITVQQLTEALRTGVRQLLQDRLPVKNIPKTSSSPAHHEVLKYPVLGSPAIDLIVALAKEPASGVTFRLWTGDANQHGDDELVYAEDPIDCELFRIPDLYGKRDEYWLEVTAHQADIHEVLVAETPSELARA